MPADQVRPYSVEAYRALLGRLVADGRRFARFVDDPPADGRAIYLRHDVDYSLELAVELAEVNAELGVQGTFFVQVRAELYNVLAPFETARVQRLRALGQRLALHYLPAGDSTANDDAEGTRADFELLRQVEPELDPVFSWHRPGEGFGDRPARDVPGLVNVYGDRFFRAMPYLSDSIHKVSVAELEASLAREKSRELQLLLHPVNWIAGGSSGVEILIRGWLRLLRDHERTLLENRAYVDSFPNGMSPQLFAQFERELLAAAATV
jgi:hypothetical protein